jgi:hypothetical protein
VGIPEHIVLALFERIVATSHSTGMTGEILDIPTPYGCPSVNESFILPHLTKKGGCSKTHGNFLRQLLRL